jgi:hypothetical protein
MTNEKKCCGLCEWIVQERDEYDRGIGLTYECRDSSCPCHSPAPQGREICPGCKVCVARDTKTGKDCVRLYKCACHYFETLTEDLGPGKDTLEAPQTEKWAEEFDNAFPLLVEPHPDLLGFGKNQNQAVKFFIRNLLASQRKEDAERIADLPAVAGELDPYVKVAMTGNMAQMFDYGYNKAKDDALRILGERN